MPQTINTNVASLNAQRNLNSSQSDANTALQRLSSGLRINSAKDDAAGLAISNRLTSQINGINQAIRNAGDGISVAQIAEGALAETGDILQRLRELAVQSANSSNSGADRAALQVEVAQLQEEMNRIANTTSFGDKKLLNGSFSSETFQVGAQVGETITFSISSARATDLGQAFDVTNMLDNLQNAGRGATAAAANAITAQNLIFSVGTETTTVAVAADSSAKQIASDISSNVSGLTATASTSATIQFANDDTQGSATFAVTIQGQTLAVDMTQATLSATTGAAKAAALKTAIDSNAALSGSLTVSIADDTITLVDADGDNITIVGDTGNTATATDMTIDSGGTGSVVVDNQAANLAAVAVGAITLTAASNTTVAVYSDTDTTVSGSSSVAAQDTGTVAAGTSRISDVDISTVTGANTALGLIDAALTTLNTQRATLGAVQNRFDSVISNLSNVSENSSAARSRIQDADFAQETANLARAQILQQAGISVLAQANAQPQNVLALLQ
ncbi:flagellin [marine gamma proteobacterium HTCC2080]|nr:flagellin [marine gamma proteobacterium HTCC2080]